MPGVVLLEHTDVMETYMRASHLFITKPGGLSSTEAAASQVPVIHTAAIPGCESQNARYFASHGMSVWAKTTDEMLRMADQLLTGDELAKNMIECQRRGIDPDAAAQICDLAEQL